MLPEQPPKIVLNSKVVKIDPKIIISMEKATTDDTWGTEVGV
jgi:hypothetical protein